MPGPYRVDALFNTLTGPGAGWSESLYWGPAQDIDTAMFNFNNSGYAFARLALLTQDYQWVATRLTDISTPRSARIVFFDVPTGRGTFPSGIDAGGSMPPFVALKVAMNFAVGKTRAYHLRGIPTGVVSNTYAFTGAVALYNTRLTTWLSALSGGVVMGGSLSLGKRLVTPSSQALIATINAVNPFAPNQLFIVITGQTVPPIVAGDIIRVKNVSGVDWVNKLWKVQSIGPNLIPAASFLITTLPHKQFVVGTFPVASGIVIRQGYTVQPCTAASVVSGVFKKTGRPFGELRGRRGVIHG
jgi:hypothetical protein